MKSPKQGGAVVENRLTRECPHCAYSYQNQSEEIKKEIKGAMTDIEKFACMGSQNPNLKMRCPHFIHKDLVIFGRRLMTRS